MYRIKKVAEILSENKYFNNDKMLDLKNIYTENMFFKEQLMRTRGLAASLRISSWRSISLLEHKALDTGHQVLPYVEEDDYHEVQGGGQKVSVGLGNRVNRAGV